ncbi:hypothetical protein [Alkalicoccus chagannorensis]|uniref:hypothetical protein n=1 Tax=Alkalicoccus chagannorensis TaxID=427072 RepID=UPI0004157FF8|nr:hypothetical protein [Alkalicoccus chagannorensis]
MKKSDFLDDMRLEVGLAYDYAESREDFMVKVLQTLYHSGGQEMSLTIHKWEGGRKRLFYALGMNRLTKKQETLGNGFFFPGSSRMVTYTSCHGSHALFLPVFSEREELQYVITMKLIDSAYKVTRQDMIFVQELLQFIQAKQSTFSS